MTLQIKYVSERQVSINGVSGMKYGYARVSSKAQDYIRQDFDSYKRPRREVTRVTGWDDDGRITSFEKIDAEMAHKHQDATLVDLESRIRRLEAKE
jgi:hypothetical protein